MNYSLRIIWFLVLFGCQPAKDPYGPIAQRTAEGVGISGVRVSNDELVSFDVRIAATRECLNKVAVEETIITVKKKPIVCPPTNRPVRGKVERIHIEPTCSIEVTGYGRPQQGSVQKGVVRLARTNRALQHEATVLLLNGYHSHAMCAPTILCEHAGPKAIPVECEK